MYEGGNASRCSVYVVTIICREKFDASSIALLFSVCWRTRFQTQQEIICNAVEIERELVCRALSCDLVGRNLLGLKEASVKYELIHCL